MTQLRKFYLLLLFLQAYPNSISNPTSRGAPGTVNWVHKYHSSLSAGQYYKHDSLLDSASDVTSLTAAGSNLALASRPRRHPKMGLSGPASSLDSVVGVGVRRGVSASRCCSCCDGGEQVGYNIFFSYILESGIKLNL